MLNPYLVPCLVELRGEFNQAYPTRDKGADGWIADAVHNSTSDHQADSKGRVRAIDIDVDLHGAPSLWDRCERLRQRQASGADGRLEYIIHMRKIASRSHGWLWRPYTGTSDPHTNHAHFSARHDGTGYTDTRPWGVLEDTVSWTDDVITNPSWRADAKTNPTVQAKFALYDAWNQAHAANVATAAILAQLKALTGKDFVDEQAIVSGVLTGLPVDAIVAAIPADMAQQVVDKLAARMQA